MKKIALKTSRLRDVLHSISLWGWSFGPNVLVFSAAVIPFVVALCGTSVNNFDHKVFCLYEY